MPGEEGEEFSKMFEDTTNGDEENKIQKQQDQEESKVANFNRMLDGEAYDNDYSSSQ